MTSLPLGLSLRSLCFKSPMDTLKYTEVFERERNGRRQEAFELLEQLAKDQDPMALIELGCRYYSVDGQKPEPLSIEPDDAKSKFYLKEGKARLEELAQEGDSEAMRMLGYVYLGLLGIYEKSVQKGEAYLLASFERGCCFAANDLATFYQGSDIEKARYYYQEAEKHNCRVVHNDDLET